MDDERQRLVATSAEFQQSMVDDTADQWQKNTGSMYPCSRWSLGSFAVMLLA